MSWAEISYLLRRPKLLPVFLLLVILGVEREWPYYFTLRKVRRAKLLTGEPALARLAEALGTCPRRVHFHRCDYCRNFDSAPGVIHVQVTVSGDNANQHFFAFHKGRCELVPSDSEALARFADLVPPFIRMLRPRDDRGRILLPAHWLTPTDK